jgi:hypothetical protein
MKHGTATPLAVVLDVARWGREPTADTGEPALAARLAAQGWRAVGAGPTDQVSRLWERLGVTGRRRHDADPSTRTLEEPAS